MKTFHYLILNIFTFVVLNFGIKEGFAEPNISDATYSGSQVENAILGYESSAAKKKKKNKGNKNKNNKNSVNVAGTYSGTLVRQKIKSFVQGCSVSESFPASIVVTSGKNNKISATLGTVPIGFGGQASAKGFNVTGKYSLNNTNRTYKISGSNVTSTSAKITFVETVSAGKKKACEYTHSGVFSRI